MVSTIQHLLSPYLARSTNITSPLEREIFHRNKYHDIGESPTGCQRPRPGWCPVVPFATVNRDIAEFAARCSRRFTLKAIATSSRPISSFVLHTRDSLSPTFQSRRYMDRLAT